MLLTSAAVAGTGETVVPVVQLKVVDCCGYIITPNRNRLANWAATCGTTVRAVDHFEGAEGALIGSGTPAIEPDLSWTMNSTGSSVQGAAAADKLARAPIRAIARADMRLLSAVGRSGCPNG
ncbi:MAG: hypothetical protein H6Q89_2545 [Myxococcaceae bacterium]|nr:hypothetical protein [Myxococcaceae bacterium]